MEEQLEQQDAYSFVTEFLDENETHPRVKRFQVFYISKELKRDVYKRQVNMNTSNSKKQRRKSPIIHVAVILVLILALIAMVIGYYVDMNDKLMSEGRKNLTRTNAVSYTHLNPRTAKGAV